MNPILVTGATGTIGAHVVRDLRERGLPVRPFSRTAGDLGDPVAVRAAVAGASQVFLCTANGPQQLEHERAVIDAAAAAGVRRIVKISTVGAEPGSPAPFWDVHGRSERHLAASGVPSVVLRACFLMSNIDPAATAIVAPAAGARIAMVDPADVAACAAAALAGEVRGTFLLTGPEALTFPDVAEVLGVGFVPVPDAAAREAMTAAGMPGWLAEGIVAIFGRLREGAAEEVTGDVRRLLGRDPRSFGDYAASLAVLTPAGG
jgi:uncharacterized protein YbjT (DUF2867 family)